MTQTGTRSPLSIRVTPMQVPEAPPQAVSESNLWAGQIGLDTSSSHQLLLHPGEPGELVVQLENCGSHALQVQLQVEGNFPPQWCLVALEGQILEPRQRMEAVLYFVPPIDFFENQALIHPGQALQLDYQGRLYVQYTPQSLQENGHSPGVTQNEGVAFSLHLRPHSLYLDFLPDVYREIDFMGRFLSLFEQAFEPIGQALDVMWAYLDPLTAPEAMLPFLASWVAWPTDARWSSDRQRRLIRHALEIYQWRGTRRGLQLFLHLYTDLPLDDAHIQIIESSGQGFTFGDAKLGEETRLGGGKPYHFTVRLCLDEGQSIDEALVRAVIEQEKPAFCTYDLVIEAGGDRV